MPQRAYAFTLVMIAALVAGAWAVPDKSRHDARDPSAVKSAPVTGQNDRGHLAHHEQPVRSRASGQTPA